MKEQFIPYELSLKLKSIGFDEKCIAYYRNDRQNNELEFTTFGLERDFNNIESELHLSPIYNGKNKEDVIKSLKERNLWYLFTSAPLWQQAFDWFDEKFGIFASFDKIDHTRYFYYDFMIICSKNREYDDEGMIDSAIRTLDKGKYKSYNEARLECLKKLIEIVENDNNTKS